MTRLGRKQAVAGYLFMLPSLVILTLFLVTPILFGFYVSLRRWNMLTPLSRTRFVGLDNYLYLFQDDPLFADALVNTLKYTVGMVLLTVGIGLLMAVALNGPVAGKGLFRTVYFIPVVTSMVAVSIVWYYLYHPAYGLLNELLRTLGLPTQGWLFDTSQSLPSIMVMNAWKRAGYYMVILLAGLQGIPKEYYEAAQVDGATRFTSFVRVTLPLLRPALLLALVVCTIEAAQVFTPVFVMTKGGPANSSNVAVLHIYNTAFNFLKMGTAAAMSYVLFVLMFGFTLLQARLLREGGVVSY